MSFKFPEFSHIHCFFRDATSETEFYRQNVASEDDRCWWVGIAAAKMSSVTLQLTGSQFVSALSPTILAVDRQLQDDVMGRLPSRDEGSVL
jgi:hypothetical protein